MTTVSEISIFNRALLRLGEGAISSFDQDDFPARLGTLYFAETRDALIAQYNWTFATTRAVLAPLSAPPVFGFRYQFQPPADMLRLRGLYDKHYSASNRNYSGSDTVHKMERGLILCDVNPLYIYYMARIEDPTLLPPMFRQALELALAEALAIPLTNSPEKHARMGSQLKDTIKTAHLVEAIQGTPEILDAPELMNSRGGMGSFGPRIGPVV